MTDELVFEPYYALLSAFAMRVHMCVSVVHDRIPRTVIYSSTNIAVQQDMVYPVYELLEVYNAVKSIREARISIISHSRCPRHATRVPYLRPLQGVYMGHSGQPAWRSGYFVSASLCKSQQAVSQQCSVFVHCQLTSQPW